MFRAFIKNEAGATAIEYAIIGAMISITCVAVFSPFSTEITTLYSKITGAFESVGQP